MNYSFFYKFNYLLTRSDRISLFILVIMSFILSIIETVGISAIMPLISTASNPDLIHTNVYYQTAYDLFKLSSDKEFIVTFASILIIFYIFRGLYTVYIEYLMTKFSMHKYRDFTNQLYENYLNMPYIEFVKRNISTLSKTVHTEASYLSLLIQNVLTFFVEVIVILILYMLLLAVNVKMTIVLTFLLSIKVSLLLLTISKKIKKKGSERTKIQDNFYRVINILLQNLKVIKFISNQDKLLREYRKLTDEFADILISSKTLQIVPKTVLEAIGLSILMLMIIYIVIFSDNLSDVVPIISMYALALYRILPATTKIVTSYNNIIYYSATLDIVYDDISCEYKQEEQKDIISFQNTIDIKNLCFTYDSNVNIIDNFSLKIKKGEKIAFVGESGSGKSTIIDLICGIYKPNSGQILIDGVELKDSNIVSWRRRIGYIPQDIYLFDGTISENITFGRDYNEDKLIKVLKQANMYDFIMQKDGFGTMVGDGGVQLSGGQKQRVGIARALYGNPEILVLDEATSALDTETEQVIMDEIYKISDDKTLIIIAHRLSTIERCDIKIDLSSKTR